MKIRTLTQTALLCAAGSMIAFPAVRSAAAASTQSHIVAAEAEHVTGTIVKVDFSSKSFTLRTADDKTLEIRINEETKFTLNGKKATKEEAVQTGATATVRHENKTASRVDSVMEG